MALRIGDAANFKTSDGRIIFGTVVAVTGNDVYYVASAGVICVTMGSSDFETATL